MSEPTSIAIPPATSLPMRLLSDERLARLAAAGDTRAFEQIFSRHKNELYRYCRGILTQHEDAQDALQATMVAALHSLPGDRREIKLKPWLYRVAHNEAITILRRRRAAGPSDAAPEVSPSADVEAESRERLHQLVDDLDSLPERQRGALTMRELSGMAYDEVAAALGLSPGAARQAVYEARGSLQSLAEGREMECELARRAISERDGRVLRGRKLRAHIRGCDGCRDFEAAIVQRRRDFQILSPALPGAAGAGLLATLLGGEAARGVAASGAVKALATIGAAAVIGTGAAGFSGAIHAPGLNGEKAKKTTQTFEQGQRGSESPASAGPGSPTTRRSADGNGKGTGQSPAGARRDHGRSAGQGSRGAHAGKASTGSGGSNANGAGEPTAAGSNPALPPKSQGKPPSGSSAGGNSAANAHGANAGGNSAVNSSGSNAGGNSATAHGANPGGNSAAAGSNAGGASAAHAQASTAPGAQHSQAASHSSSPVHGGG